MFTEHKRASWLDKLNRIHFAFRLGDRVAFRTSGKRGTVIGRNTLRDLLSSRSEHEAKDLLDRLKSEHHDVNKYCTYQVSIKDLIIEVESSDIEPDNSHERENDESKEVEDARSEAEGRKQS